MIITQRLMHKEQAPPGFWPWPEDALLVEGVELESAVPTRFFQTLDPVPRSLGRLSWRIQLNRIVAGQADMPMFRTFYSGVEWNLNHPDYRWFLTAWFKWEGSPGGPGEPHCAPPASIDGETVVFSLTPPKSAPGALLHLRSRVDARDRNRIADSIRSQAERTERPHDTVIVIDDVIHFH
jgi:hypothetical protein